MIKGKLHFLTVKHLMDDLNLDIKLMVESSGKSGTIVNKVHHVNVDQVSDNGAELRDLSSEELQVVKDMFEGPMDFSKLHEKE